MLALTLLRIQQPQGGDKLEVATQMNQMKQIRTMNFASYLVNEARLQTVTSRIRRSCTNAST